MTAEFEQLQDMMDCLRERTERKGYVCAVVRSNGASAGVLKPYM